ncbi:unnamed protein product, partial [Pylaiella littoralis]
RPTLESVGDRQVFPLRGQDKVAYLLIPATPFWYMFPVPFNRSIAGVTVTINLTFGFAEEMDGSAGIKEWDEHARHGPGSEVTPDRQCCSSTERALFQHFVCRQNGLPQHVRQQQFVLLPYQGKLDVTAEHIHAWERRCMWATPTRFLPSRTACLTTFARIN